jgi:hypothetical protein
MTVSCFSVANSQSWENARSKSESGGIYQGCASRMYARQPSPTMPSLK